jgi:hypothetical protein
MIKVVDIAVLMEDDFDCLGQEDCPTIAILDGCKRLMLHVDLLEKLREVYDFCEEL